MYVHLCSPKSSPFNNPRTNSDNHQRIQPGSTSLLSSSSDEEDSVSTSSSSSSSTPFSSSSLFTSSSSSKDLKESTELSSELSTPISSSTRSMTPLAASTRLSTHCICSRSQDGSGSIFGSSVLNTTACPDLIPNCWSSSKHSRSPVRLGLVI
ncbi:hypothetical protein BJY01DRAFT_203164, partial [Aspergillus pseudoustus]